MFKKIQKLSILFVIISVSILLLMEESYAEINVKLVMNPEVTTIKVGSEPIALVANASGSNLTFKWELLGPGEFEGSTTSSAIHYIPPEKITRKSAKATITVKVSDDQGNEATAGVTFNIIPFPRSEVTPAPSPTPSLTPPTPSLSPTIVIGEVKITEPRDGDSVGGSRVVTGTYTEGIKDDIWVALWPESAPDRCYFQSDNPAAGAPAFKEGEKGFKKQRGS